MLFVIQDRMCMVFVIQGCMCMEFVIHGCMRMVFVIHVVCVCDSGSIYDEDDKLIKEAKPYVKDTGVLKKNHCLSIMVRTSDSSILLSTTSVIKD